MPDKKNLVINADDLALHTSVNRAICQAHLQGIVTSTSILASGPAFEDAVNQVRELPTLGVGVHLCLVNQLPVSAPESIPTLIAPNGHLHRDHAKFIINYILGKINLAELQRELEAQVSRVLEKNIQPTHLDSHQHLHVLPAISKIVADISRKYGISKVRIPAENFAGGIGSTSTARQLQGWVLKGVATKVRRRFVSHGLTSTDHFFGFSCGGQMDRLKWLQVIPLLPPGSTEIMVHPGEDNDVLQAATGWGYHWADELKALCDPEVKSRLEECGVNLINFGELLE